ncbi:unnamed protein product [Leptidea sinapis]|uniref:Ig-like domain-containing protein n=1 Tax=Leptidea sinapis TaxID=189913 RepID=A0A5E4QR21_9NEOP|nr:unnamed protein product [Leptidea sinapis]
MTLVVNDMSRGDSGSYRCHVDNHLGNAQAEISLYNEERYTDTPLRDKMEDPALEQSDIYVVLSQHQMQTLEPLPPVLPLPTTPSTLLSSPPASPPPLVPLVELTPPPPA